MVVKTTISRSRFFDKQLNRVPNSIRLKVMAWILLVEDNGLNEVRKTKGYHDEPLKGKKQGLRAVRMNKAYRLIYREIEDNIYIELLEIHKHDY